LVVVEIYVRFLPLQRSNGCKNVKERRLNIRDVYLTVFNHNQTARLDVHGRHRDTQKAFLVYIRPITTIIITAVLNIKLIRFQPTSTVGLGLTL